MIGLLLSPLDSAVLTRLKCLEQWVDNLSPAFLQPLLLSKPVQVMQPLMSALYAMVKPQPSANGPDAFRILGKLGGWNRDFLAAPGMLRPL